VLVSIILERIVSEGEFDYWFIVPPEERDYLLAWCSERNFQVAFTWNRDLNFAVIRFTTRAHAMVYQLIHYRRHADTWKLGFLCRQDPYSWQD
jgi:hypothetical protein